MKINKELWETSEVYRKVIKLLNGEAENDNDKPDEILIQEHDKKSTESFGIKNVGKEIGSTVIKPKVKPESKPKVKRVDDYSDLKDIKIKYYWED